MVLVQQQNQTTSQDLQLVIRKEKFEEFEKLLFSLEIYNLSPEFVGKELTVFVDCGIFWEEYHYKIVQEKDFYYFTTI